MSEHANLNSIHKFAYVQSSDPGAIGAKKGWVDTNSSPFMLKVRNDTNTGWSIVGSQGLLTTLSNYDNTLEGAVLAIGSNKVILSVMSPITLGNDLVIPSNIQLDPHAIITVAAGKTLTVGSMLNPENKKVFDTSALNSKVIFSKSAVEAYNVAWWTGISNGVNVTNALNQIIESCVNNGGGIIDFPEGNFVTNGAHQIADNTIIKGKSAFVSPGFGGTNLKLVSPTSSYMWKVGEGEYSITFRDILLDGNGTSSKTSILLEGSSPNTSGDVSLFNVTLANFNKGFHHHSLSGSWQLAQVLVEQCIFQNNNIAIDTNSLNSSFALESTNFYIPASGIGINADGIGAITIKSSEFAGAGSTSKVAVVSGSHVQLNFIGCQDENCGTFIENNASDLSGIINLYGNLVQSKIQVNESCKITSIGNNYLSRTFRFGPSAVANIISINDNIRSLDQEGSTISPVRLTENIDGGSLIMHEMNFDTGKFVTRVPTKFVSPIQLNGNPTVPMVSIGNISDTSESKIGIRIGRLDANEVFDFYYDIWRQNSSDDAGRLKFSGNQTNYVGYDLLNGDLYTEGAIRSKSYQLTDGATITIDPRASNNFFATLAGNRTLAMTVLSSTYDKDRADGQEITIEVIQDATGSRTLTLGTGTGQFAFGTDIPSVTLTTGAGKTDLLTVKYSKRLDKWMVKSFVKGF